MTPEDIDIAICWCTTATGEGRAPVRCLEPADGMDGLCTRCRNRHLSFEQAR
jgi:hypothetical protein